LEEHASFTFRVKILIYTPDDGGSIATETSVFDFCILMLSLPSQKTGLQERNSKLETSKQPNPNGKTDYIYIFRQVYAPSQCQTF
jgi:hypothetical protein